MTTPHDLQDLRRRADDYIARVKAKGRTIVTFSTPCGHQLETPAAPKGERWDTLATCHHCGATYIKITIGDRVDALDY